MQLEIKHLSKTYGELKALEDVNFCLQKGISGLLGVNGAGKSTLIGIMTTNIRADQGEILLDGKNIETLGRDYRKRIGYVPQEQIYYPNMTVFDFLMYTGVLKDLPSKERKKEVEAVLERLELNDVKDRKVGTFSGGMIRKTILAQALIGDPQILILDEPTAGLDPHERVRLKKLLKELGADKSILIATHIVSDIDGLVDQILLLKNGRIIPNHIMEELEKPDHAGKLEDMLERYLG